MTQCSSSGSSSSTSSSGHPDFKDQTSNHHHKLKVVVRIKPLGREKGSKRILHAINNKMVMIDDENDKQKSRSVPRQYLYDIVFGEDSDQEAVYEGTAQALVQDVLNGYNATVFAYGATGSGKTHTMVGNPSDPGIMVRALNDIFVTTRRLPDKINSSVHMSYLELYNENIRDLLNPSSGHLELRDESRGRNWLIPNLTEVSTNSTEEVMQLLHKGNKSRTVEPTAANETSSRSHALLVVTVKQSCKPPDTETYHRSRVMQGRLFMVDLAGSEKIKETKCDGKRLQEGAHINRSLLALGNCINALAGGARYVNYRDSKLTRLLKDSLSGNCRTIMIATVSPAQAQLDESRNTLIYADRANRISTKVEKNILDVGYHVSQYRNIICDLKNEIARLRGKMKSGSVRTKEDLPKGTNDDFKSLRDKIVSAFKDQMRLRRKLMELDGHILSLNVAAEQQHAIISDWESRNNKLFKNSREMFNNPVNTDYLNDAVRNYLRFLHDPKEGEEHVPVEQAWNELEEINKELEKYAEMRATTEKELETCRQRGVALENELPGRITSDEERELLSLMLRVHELEAEKMMLQSERLVKQQELRRREAMIIRYDRQRQISDEIITRQRRIMEDGQLQLPTDLQDLYTMYQQEIHSAAYNDQNLLTFASSMDCFGKLPPICSRFSLDCLNNKSGTPSSSVDSDWESPLPPIQEPSEVERVMGPIVHPLIPPSVLFPPIQLGMNKKAQDNKRLRRIASDNVISSKATKNNMVRFSTEEKIIPAKPD